MRIATALVVVSPMVLAVACTSYQKQAGYGGEPGSGGQVISSSPGSQGTTATRSPVYGTQNPADADSALAGEVRRALNTSDLSTLAPNINVSAQNGAVTLTGTVPTDQQRQRIDSLVRNVSGVNRVNDLLQVSVAPTGSVDQGSRVYPGTSYQAAPAPASSATTGEIFNLHVQGLNETDRTLAQRILDGLRNDPALGSLLPVVNINVADGKVTLTGRVQNDAQRRTIESAVQRAVGGGNVEDQIQVTSATPR